MVTLPSNFSATYVPVRVLGSWDKKTVGASKWSGVKQYGMRHKIGWGLEGLGTAGYY
jgi:hypothetical protein